MVRHGSVARALKRLREKDGQAVEAAAQLRGDLDAALHDVAVTVEYLIARWRHRAAMAARPFDVTQVEEEAEEASWSLDLERDAAKTRRLHIVVNPNAKPNAPNLRV